MECNAQMSMSRIYPSHNSTPYPRSIFQIKLPIKLCHIIHRGLFPDSYVLVSNVTSLCYYTDDNSLIPARNVPRVQSKSLHATLYSVSFREWVWHHRARPREIVSRCIRYATIPGFFFEHVRKHTSCARDNTVILEGRQSIAMCLFQMPAKSYNKWKTIVSFQILMGLVFIQNPYIQQ